MKKVIVLVLFGLGLLSCSNSSNRNSRTKAYSNSSSYTSESGDETVLQRMAVSKCSLCGKVNTLDMTPITNIKNQSVVNYILDQATVGVKESSSDCPNSQSGYHNWVQIKLTKKYTTFHYENGEVSIKDWSFSGPLRFFALRGTANTSFYWPPSLYTGICILYYWCRSVSFWFHPLLQRGLYCQKCMHRPLRCH